MNLITITEIEKAFTEMDEQLFNNPSYETQGNPFTICTNGAIWIKDNFLPNSIVVGYSIDNNPIAEIGQEINGHDFILVEDRYIVDFWYKHVCGNDVPVFLDLFTQPDLVLKYYGDPKTWEKLY